MTPKHGWCIVLIIALSLAFAMPAQAATSLKTQGDEIVIGVAAAAAVVAVLITVLVLHHNRSQSKTITGCVASGESGMSLIDEKDKKTYALSGDTAGIKPGDRMKLQGKKVKLADPDKTLGWEATKVANDYGVCQP
jgi:hypothetical protein